MLDQAVLSPFELSQALLTGHTVIHFPGHAGLDTLLYIFPGHAGLDNNMHYPMHAWMDTMKCIIPRPLDWTHYDMHYPMPAWLDTL